MYMVPMKYKCDRCGHEEQYSQHEPHDAPRFESGPICTVCFERFVKEHCGTLHYAGPPLTAR